MSTEEASLLKLSTEQLDRIYGDTLELVSATERRILDGPVSSQLFLSERRSFGAFDLEVSARKDWRTIEIPFNMYADQTREWLDFLKSVLSEEQFAAEIERRRQQWTESWNPPSEADPFSIALSGVWNLDDSNSIALSLSRSERAPQEFKDDRHRASLNAARARTVEIARLLARSDPGSCFGRSAG